MKFAQLAARTQTVPEGRSTTRRGTMGVNPGVWTIPVATLAALALLPSDPSEPGSLMLSAWVLAAGILAAIIFDAVARGFARVFRAEHVLFISIVIVVFPELLQPYYSSSLSSEITREVFIAIGVFGTAIALGSSLKPPRLPKSVIDLATRQYSHQLLYRIMLACWVLAMLNYAIASDFSLSAMIAGLRTWRWDAPWARGAMGGWDAFRDFLTYFGHLVPIFTVLLALRLGKWAQPRVLIGLVCSAISLAFIAQGGGRRVIVVIIGSSMLTWIFVKRRSLRPRHAIVIGGLLVMTALTMEVILQFRNQGFAALEESDQDLEIQALHVDNNFNSLAETLRLIPFEVNYVGFQHLIYVLVRPIPRVFWEGKPIGSGFDLAQALGRKGLTISITAIGEWYMSFGWLGIVVGGAVMGWLARLWSQLAENDYGIAGAAFYALGAMAFFLGMRSLLELVLMTYPIICWYGLDRLMWRWATSKGKSIRRGAGDNSLVTEARS